MINLQNWTDKKLFHPLNIISLPSKQKPNWQALSSGYNLCTAPLPLWFLDLSVLFCKYTCVVHCSLVVFLKRTTITISFKCLTFKLLYLRLNHVLELEVCSGHQEVFCNDEHKKRKRVLVQALEDLSLSWWLNWFKILQIDSSKEDIIVEVLIVVKSLVNSAEEEWGRR